MGNLKEFAQNKLILKTQERFKSERHYVYTEVINMIALYSNDHKMQSIDLTKTYEYRTSIDIIYVIEKIKCYNTIQRCFNFDYVTNKDIKNNPNWPKIPDQLEPLDLHKQMHY